MKIILIVLITFQIFISRCYNQVREKDPRITTFIDQSIVKIKETKSIIYTRERTLLPIRSKDTSYMSFNLFRLRISDSLYFFKLKNDNFNENRLTYIKDSSGCYMFGSNKKILEKLLNVDTPFLIHAYPFIELAGIKLLLEIANNCKIDSISSPNYIVYSTDSMENPSSGMYERYKLYQNRITKIIEWYEEDIWINGLHQYLLDQIRIIDEDPDDLYNLISLKNTSLDLK